MILISRSVSEFANERDADVEMSRSSSLLFNKSDGSHTCSIQWSPYGASALALRTFQDEIFIQDDCSDRHGVFDRERDFHSEDNKRICYLLSGG